MDQIYVRSDFAERDEYRLVSIDDAWVKQFRERTCDAAREASLPSSQKRPRMDDVEASVSVVLVMKGEEQLCLHDATSTRSVRRVEYSNVMMLAKRRLNAKGRAALAEATSSSAALVEPPTPPQVRERSDNVVVASLSRMFDSHAANPQLNILAVLAESQVGIEELETEEEEEHEGRTHSGTSAPTGHTFAQLARRFHSSPQELARLLVDVGAVVHRGRVRLLRTSLVYEALRAALTFFDGADAATLSWQAVRHHLCPSVFPDVVLRSLEAVYGPPTPPDSTDADVTLGGLAGLLNLPRVLIGLAAGVFDTDGSVTRRPVGANVVARGLPLEVFFAKWWDSVPSSLFGVGSVPHRSAANAEELFLEILRGHAILEPRVGGKHSTSSHSGIGDGGGGGEGRSQGTLWWLPKDALTSDFAARLSVLFALRPQRWNQLDLKAYMEGLLAPDENFQHTIVRYVREYRIPGQVVQYAPLT